MAVWLDEIDLSDIWDTYRDLDLDNPEVFKYLRVAVALRLTGSDWAVEHGFPQLFAGVHSIDRFNDRLDLLYDAADHDRVWIKTF